MHIIKGMNFTWQSSKQQSNLNKHGFDFADTEKVFNGPTITEEERSTKYPDLRFKTTGLLNSEVVVIIHNETENEINVISMRKAENHEIRTFFSYL